MPKHHHLILVLLNKHKYVDLAKNAYSRFRNDRLAFYIFMMLMSRMRNPSNFKWWGLCNAGASYGGGEFSQTSTHFGISIIHQTSMARRTLKNEMTLADVMVKM